MGREVVRPKKNDPRKLKDELAKALSKQDWRDALQACRALHELDPKDDRTLHKLGEIHQKLGQTEEAIAAYRKLVDFYADDGRLPRAIAVMKIIIELDPDDQATQKKLALLYAKRGLPKAAAEKTAEQDVLQITGKLSVRAPRAAPPEGRSESAAPVEPSPQALAASRDVETSPAQRTEPAAEGEVLELDEPWVSEHLAPSPIETAAEEVLDLGKPLPPGSPMSPAAATSDAEVPESELEELEELEMTEHAAAPRPPPPVQPRRQLGPGDLHQDTLLEIDLAEVEMAPAESPRLPPTPLFSDLAPEELHAVLGKVAARRFAPGETIVRQGDIGKSIFIVSEGEVVVRARRQSGERRGQSASPAGAAPDERGEVEVATLGEGAFFGEFGMFMDGRRHATVVAKTEVQVLELRNDDLNAVAERHPRVKEVLAEFYRARALDTALAVSRLFGHLPREERASLASQCHQEPCKAGELVLREGQEGRGLFLVKRGRFRVQTEDLEGQPLVLADLGPGDFFGEISLLSGSPVTASVVAAEAGELLRFDRTAVLEVCARFPALRAALEKVREKRIHETIDRLSEAGLV